MLKPNDDSKVNASVLLLLIVLWDAVGKGVGAKQTAVGDGNYPFLQRRKWRCVKLRIEGQK